MLAYLPRAAQYTKNLIPLLKSVLGSDIFTSIAPEAIKETIRIMGFNNEKEK